MYANTHTCVSRSFPHRNWLGRKRDRLPVSKWFFVYNIAIDDRAHSDDVHALMTCTLSHPYPKYSSTECYRAPILPRVLPPNLYVKQCITSCTHSHGTWCTHSLTLHHALILTPLSFCRPIYYRSTECCRAPILPRVLPTLSSRQMSQNGGSCPSGQHPKKRSPLLLHKATIPNSRSIDSFICLTWLLHERDHPLGSSSSLRTNAKSMRLNAIWIIRMRDIIHICVWKKTSALLEYTASV